MKHLLLKLIILIFPTKKSIKYVDSNPYFSAHAYEAPLAPGITSGRGDRRIIFTNVPSDGSLSIFTVRGQHVVTLNHENDIKNGTIEWNLRSKENLDISYGVYFLVESETLIAIRKICNHKMKKNIIIISFCLSMVFHKMLVLVQQIFWVSLGIKSYRFRRSFQ